MDGDWIGETEETHRNGSEMRGEDIIGGKAVMAEIEFN
jgi:hypothetical protein